MLSLCLLILNILIPAFTEQVPYGSGRDAPLIFLSILTGFPEKTLNGIEYEDEIL